MNLTWAIMTLAEDVIDTELLTTEAALLVLIWAAGYCLVLAIWSRGWSWESSACLSVSKVLILSLTAVGGSLVLF